MTWGASLCITLTPFPTKSEAFKIPLKPSSIKGFILLYSGGMDSYALLNLCKDRLDKVAHFIVNSRASKMALLALARRAPDIKVYLFDHREFLRVVREDLRDINLEEATCLACKRAMVLKVSEYGIAVMGDSLGQVASQTLHNMSFISKGTKVVRPLIGSDKEDIEAYVDEPLAKYVGSMKCPFKPDVVITKPKRVHEVEFIVRKRIGYVKFLGVWSAREIAELG